MSNPFTNDEGHLSGTKLILLLSAALAATWGIRDLINGKDLSEAHVALLGILLIIGLLNRVSARGSFRLKVGPNEIEVKETHNDRQ